MEQDDAERGCERQLARDLVRGARLNLRELVLMIEAIHSLQPEVAVELRTWLSRLVGAIDDLEASMGRAGMLDE